MRVRPLFLSLVVLALSSIASAGKWDDDQGASQVDTQNATRWFRRVLVPADRLEEVVPKSGVRHVPMTPEEFERLISQTRDRSGRPSPGAEIASARYSARLVGYELFDGEAHFKISHWADGPVMLPLSPCAFAVSQARWLDEEDGIAKLGLGTDDKLQVLVERPGGLKCDWSLRGRRDQKGEISFHWELPLCPANSLVLDLPKDRRPLLERGILIEEGSEDDEYRRWRIELGGHHRFVLRVVPAEGSQELPASIHLQQSTVYDLSLQGLEVRARLQMDVPDEPPRQAEMVLASELKLVEAQYGDTSVGWSVSPSSDGSARVILKLPEPIRGTGRVLRLRALAPLKVDQTWRLPAIQLEGVSWEKADATLLVSDPLVLEGLAPILGRQLRTGSLPAPRSGKTIQLQYFSPKSGVEVALGRLDATLEVDCGTTIVLSSREMAGQIVAGLSVKNGQRFQIDAQVVSPWIIDSVESVPADALGDWSLEEEPGEENSADSKLTVRLLRPLIQSRPIRLKISARRLHSPLGRTLRNSDLVPLRFPGALPGRQLTWLRAAEPHELGLTGIESLTRVDPKGLDAAALALFVEPPRDPLFENEPRSTRLRVALETRKPSYSATIRVEATLSERSLTESYWFRCVPEGVRRVDRVLIGFSQPRPGPLHWEVGGEEDQWAVRQLSPPGQDDDEQAAETWEIRLRQPRSVPFEIRASRTSGLTAEEAVSLASLPEAANQQATLVVGSIGSSYGRIENRRLEQIPIETAPLVDRFDTTRASYRYDPSRDTVGALDPPLTIVPLAVEAAPPAAWVWDCRLESRCQPSGTSEHLATYFLQNAGAEEVRLRLPKPAILQGVHGVWVDDAQAAWHPGAEDHSSSLIVQFPPGRKKFPVVSVHFTTAGQPLGIAGSIVSAFPEVDLPILSRHWMVWLPPSHEARGLDLQSSRLTWFQRLFGPLGREPGDTPFDPLKARDWQGVFGHDNIRAAAEGEAVELLRAIGNRLAGNGMGQDTGRLDWGSLLTDESLETRPPAGAGGWPKPELLVDRQALSALGIGPRTSIAVPSGGALADVGMGILERSGVLMLVHAEAVVVTTSTRANLDRAQLAPVESEEITPLEANLLWWIEPGPLADRISRAAGGQPDSWFLLAGDWGQWLDDPRLPWHSSKPAAFDSADAIGWTAHELECSGELPPRIWYIRRGTIETFNLCVFLAVVALACWKPLCRPAILTGLLGVFAAAAFVLPESCVRVASFALLGTIFAVCFRLIRAYKETGNHTAVDGSSCRRGSLAQAATTLLVLLAVTTLFISPLAEADEPEGSPIRLPAHRVYIPVDEKNRPTGQRYQVPEDLCDALRSRATAQTEEPQGWLLTSATYRGELAWEATSERLVLGQFKVAFDVEVLGTSVSVHVPFGGEKVSLLADGAVLDGRVIQPELQHPGGLAFRIAGRGKHRLDLALAPPATSVSGAYSGFNLAIPRLATSRLELVVPQDSPPVEVTSAVGPVAEMTDPTRLTAELGPADRLSVRWQEGVARGRGDSGVDVEQLLWLKVKDGQVVLDTHFRFTIADARLSEFSIAADPRLRLLPPEGGNPPNVHTTPGRPQVIRFEFPDPISDQAVIPATFLVTDTLGVGRIGLPYLDVLELRTTRRWMALSIDASLEEPEKQGTDRLETLSIHDFEAAWGQADKQPKYAYNLPSQETAWSIITHPRAPQTTVDQRLLLGFTPGQAEVSFEARLTTDPGYRFQYRIRAPLKLRIERVSVLEKKTERVDRLARDESGAVIVFLNGPVTGQHEMSIRGHLPTASRGKLSLPVLGIDDTVVGSSRIQLLRSPEVKVEVDTTIGLIEADTPLEVEDRLPAGRLLKSYLADCTGPVEAKLTLSANRPEIRARQITSLHCQGEYWEADVEFHISVDGGVVDEFRLRLDPEFAGPYRTVPTATLQSVNESADDDRLLLVRPSSTVTGEYRLVVSSPLTPGPGNRVSVPDIWLEDVELDEHLVLLPTRSEVQTLAWETLGLVESAVPDDLLAPSPANEPPVAYLVNGEQFHAVLRPLGGQKQVCLSDVRLVWGADHTCRGLVSFDLQPAGLSECWLRMPSECQLVQVTVSGMPASLTPGGTGRWQIPLEPSGLPQRIEVLYSGPAPDPDVNGNLRFESPTLDDLPARQVLWTVSAPSSYQPSNPNDDQRASQLDHDLARLENVVALIEQSAGLTGEDPEATIRWRRSWNRRLAACRDAVRRRVALDGSTELAQVVKHELESIDQRLARVADLAGWDLSFQHSSATPITGDAGELWLRSVVRSQPTTRSIVRDGSGSLALSQVPVDGGLFSAGPYYAAGVVSLILLILVGIRQGLVSTLLLRWPNVFGIVAGIVWWLWFSPSIIGWGIMLAGLAASFRFGWKRAGQSASAIVPLSLSDR